MDGRTFFRKVCIVSRMERITANLSRRSRRTVGSDGRQYLVAPLNLIVSGVLNGSKGPLYYPPDETKKSAPFWDGIPLVVYHPTNANGANVTARASGVWESSGIGLVRRPTFNRDKNTLRAVGWFDEERVRNYDAKLPDTAKILPRLERGEPIELSTGLYTDNEPVENGVSPKGVAYSHIARNYRPDHVAILPDQRGACSVEDGCGVSVENALNQVTINAEDDMATRQENIKYLVTNCDCWKDPSDTEVLNKLTDDKLAKLRSTAEKHRAEEVVANAAKAGFTHGTLKVVYDPTRGAFVANEVPPMMPPDKKKEGEDEEEKEGGEECGKKGEMTGNRGTKRPATMKEWLEIAPPEAKSVWNSAVKVHDHQREQVIGRLKEIAETTTNSKKKSLILNRLASTPPAPLDALEEMLAMADEPIGNGTVNGMLLPSFGGAAAPIGNRAADFDDSDTLQLPVVANYDSDE